MIEIECRACTQHWSLPLEPQTLHRLACPGCGQQASAQPIEDFASAMEDALLQLWRLRQTHHIQLSLDTRQIPAAFCPPNPPQ